MFLGGLLAASVLGVFDFVGEHHSASRCCFSAGFAFACGFL